MSKRTRFKAFSKDAKRWTRHHLTAIGFGFLFFGLLMATAGMARYQYLGCKAGNAAREADRNIYLSFVNQSLRQRPTDEQRKATIRFFNEALGIPKDQIHLAPLGIVPDEPGIPNVDWSKTGFIKNRTCRRF